jgi:DNA-binding CsgD family transcriptional regulator
MPTRTRALPPRLQQAGVTRREAEVLDALTRGASNAEIAARLFISVRTVETHISSLLSKFDAADRRELAAIARTVVVGPATSARLPLSLLELTERSPLVGRQDELGLVREGWTEAASGRRRAVLIIGEAGIGKSRLAAEVAVAADRDGATVLLGHCDQEALVPYQPIVESLTALTESAPPEVLAGAVRGFESELVALVPCLAPLTRHQPTKITGEPAAARFRLFEGVARLVMAACQDAPMLLVLEDLHWADGPTGQLLRHLLRRADRARLLVLGTVRGSRLDGQLLTLGDDLRREHGAGVMLLRGLGVGEIGTLIGARPGLVARIDADQRSRLAEHLHRETRGNPLLVGEVLRQLDSQDPVSNVISPLSMPQTVRDAVISRLQALPKDTRHLLAVAAIAGRRFRVDVVSQAAEFSAERLLEALEEAMASGFVNEATDHPGWLEFSHALVRDALEQELSTTRRQRLHRLVGEILEAEDATAHLAELAHHFHAAASPTDHTRAVTYAVAAAAQASAKLAHEQAANLYNNALEALGRSPTHVSAREVELLILQAGSYRRAGLLDLSRAAALRAVDIARRVHTPQLLADATLALAEAAPVVGSDPDLTAALSQALQRGHDLDLARRARLLASQAQAGYYDAPPEHRRDLTEQAVTAARSAGDDQTLASVLSACHVALWGLTDAEERLRIADELLALAGQLSDDELALQGHAWRVVDLLEVGDVPEADRAIAAHARLARGLGQPLHIRDTALWAATRAQLDGRFRDAERESHRALILGRRAQDPHADMFWWVQRYWLVLEQDAAVPDIAALLDKSLELAEQYAQVPAWRAKVAFLHARLGDREAAAAVASQLSAHRLAALPRDAVWIGGLYYLAEVVSFLEDGKQAAVLYDILEPYADRVVVIDRALICLGSVARVLGLLATVLGDDAAARRHLKNALARHEAMAAKPLAARTRMELAQRLRADRTAQVEANEHLTLAHASARKLGMSRLLNQTQQLLQHGKPAS